MANPSINSNTGNSANPNNYRPIGNNYNTNTDASIERLDASEDVSRNNLNNKNLIKTTGGNKYHELPEDV